MSAVRGFVSAFCVGCVMLGALYILVPKGNISKAVKYAFCLVFLCMIISAGVSLSGIETPDFSNKESEFENERLSAEIAQMIFAEALSESKINFSKITVFTDKSASGGISISKVYVYTDCSPQKVSSVIGSDVYELVVINE